MASSLWRVLVVTHRYLGVAVGLLMLMWFASGIIMMYVPFPSLSEGERLRIQAPIPWQSCCRFGDGLIADDQRIARAQIESHLGIAALRLRRLGQMDSLFDLARGERVEIDTDTERKIARDAGARIIGRQAAILAEAQITVDQWTVGRAFRDRPLFRFEFDDPARTTVYVSGTAGQIVVWTTAAQRFWNWLGTVPHWLYFTGLRSDPRLWSQVVIWTSILGTFLTVIGIALGVMQFKGGAGRRMSPYQGWFYWHHLIGLVFGFVTLTWVLSGLFSMNPWGFLESRGRGEAARVQGAAPKWIDVKTSLEALRTRLAQSDAVSLTTAPLDGRLYWLVTYRDGAIERRDAAGNVAPPSESDLASAAERIAGATGIAEQRMMNEEDAYYFARPREAFVLPVYRVILADAERTRYYLDPAAGALLQRADATNRWHRWMFGGLHRLDFTAWMRWRPLWDVIMLALMLGGLGLAATGCTLAIRRIRGDLGGLFRRVEGQRTIAK